MKLLLAADSPRILQLSYDGRVKNDVCTLLQDSSTNLFPKFHRRDVQFQYNVESVLVNGTRRLPLKAPQQKVTRRGGFEYRQEYTLQGACKLSIIPGFPIISIPYANLEAICRCLVS